MRKLVILCGIIVIFVIASIWVQNALGRSSMSLLAKLNNVITLVSEKEWSQAKKAYAAFDSHWEQAEKWWALATDHEEIDEISRSLKKAAAYLDSEDSAGAMAELYSLTYLISHIPEKERLTLTTLF